MGQDISVNGPWWPNTYQKKYLIYLHLFFPGYSMDTYPRRIQRVSVSDTYPGIRYAMGWSIRVSLTMRIGDERVCEAKGARRLLLTKEQWEVWRRKCIGKNHIRNSNGRRHHGKRHDNVIARDQASMDIIKVDDAGGASIVAFVATSPGTAASRRKERSLPTSMSSQDCYQFWSFASYNRDSLLANNPCRSMCRAWVVCVSVSACVYSCSRHGSGRIEPRHHAGAF
jgi:hypothetical protein